jgi:hypothetical protein
MMSAMNSILHPTVVELEQQEASRRLAWKETRSEGVARYLFRPIPLRELRVLSVFAMYMVVVNIALPWVFGRKIHYLEAAGFLIAYITMVLLGRLLVWMASERKYRKL